SPRRKDKSDWSALYRQSCPRRRSSDRPTSSVGVEPTGTAVVAGESRMASASHAKSIRLSPSSTLNVDVPLRTSGIDRNGLNRVRSEEHTSELQSREKLVCRLLLEKKKK